MADPRKKRQPKRVVVLDGDKLGLIVGATFATLVMGLCFFLRQVDAHTAAIRVGWAFVLAYGATFFLVRVILRTTLYEFIEQSRRKKDRKRGRGDEGGRETPDTDSATEIPPTETA